MNAEPSSGEVLLADLLSTCGGALDAAEASYREVLQNEAEFDYHKSLEQRTRAALERIGR